MSGIIGTLIYIIIVLILVGLAWWAINQLLPLITQYLPEPFARIIHVLLVVILVLVVLWVILIILQAVGVDVPRPFRLSMPTGPSPGSFNLASGDLQGVLNAA